MRQLTPAKLTLAMFVVVGVLIAAYVGKRLFAVEEPPSETSTRMVPMAVADLEPGTRISESHLGEGPLRTDKLTRDTLLSNDVIVGRIVKKKIQAADPILSTNLYPVGEMPPLELGEGMRAVSVSVGDGVAVVNGLIRPGQFVDVHLTPNGADDERMRGGMTLRLFKGIQVLSVNRSLTQGGVNGAANTVTLELTPGQANVLILARRRGSIHLTYNPDGSGGGGIAVEDENRATLEEILNLEPIPEPPPPFVTESYRGSNRSVLQFRNGRRLDVDRRPSRSRSGGSSGPPSAGDSPSDSPRDDTRGDDSPQTAPREPSVQSDSPTA